MNSKRKNPAGVAPVPGCSNDKDSMPQPNRERKPGLVRVADALVDAFRRAGLTFTQGGTV